MAKTSLETSASETGLLVGLTSPMRGRRNEPENHWCSRCNGTEKFYDRGDRYVSVTCGKTLYKVDSPR